MADQWRLLNNGGRNYAMRRCFKIRRRARVRQASTTHIHVGVEISRYSRRMLESFRERRIKIDDSWRLDRPKMSSIG